MRFPFWFGALAALVFLGNADACGGRRSSTSATVKVRTKVRATGACCGSSAAVGVQIPATAPCDGPVCPTTNVSVVVDVGERPGVFGRLLSLHNGERARRGLPPLALDPSLCAGAQQAAEAQAARRSVGHFAPLAGASAENAAQGQATEDGVHSSWMQSPGHQANIVGPYSRVGFGQVNGPNGPYWAARFGR